MSKIEIPNHLLSKLGPEMKMDIHWIDVKLKDGSVFNGLVVRGGKYITGFKNQKNGEGEVPFDKNRIKLLRREATFKWWPFWY